MDILRYTELKAKKKVRIEKAKDEIFIIAERWDEPTGEKMGPEKEDVETHIHSLQTYKAQLVDLQARIKAIEELVSDVEKFKGGKDAR